MASNAGVLNPGEALPDSGSATKTVQNPSASAEDHAHWKPRVNPWLIAMTVALAAFMEVLDTSIANVALPHIAGNLGTSTDEGTWVLTSYLVSNAIVLPLGGWASNVIGRKNFFLLCITIFTVASFALRHRPFAADPAALPRTAGGGRRRIAADGAGHHGRLF